MRHRTKGWLSGALALSLGLASLAQAADAPVFGPGEQLTYSVKYLGMKAMTAQITVGASNGDAHPIWPLVMVAKSGPLLGFFPVNDKMVSYWDAANSRWVGDEFYADENHKRRRQKVQLEPGNVATVMKQKEGEQISQEKTPLPEGSMDLQAVTFAIRNKPLAIGARYEIPVFTGNKTFPMVATVEAKEKLDTDLGEKQVYRVKVRTDFSGKFKSNRDMTVYFTDTPQHVPVRIETDFALGSAVAELTDYKAGATVDLKSLAADRR